jgi:isocitrate/isopropylmalate dehydrogenase
MMLEHLGFGTEAKRMEAGVVAAVKEKMLTADVGGTKGTSEVAKYIAKSVR